MSFSAILTLLAECSKKSKIALMQTKAGHTDELRACILDNFSWYDSVQFPKMHELFYVF